MQQEVIRKYENKCIQDYPAGCVTMCPVHVDAKKMINYIQNEDFDNAVKVFQKKVPFPRIISRICDNPCQQHCKRQEIGGSILISELEKACVNYGKLNKKTKKPFKKNGKKAAIIGSGLSGLTVALFLYEKGYEVHVYEKKDCLGGSVNSFDEERLPRELIEKDLSIFDATDINIHLSIEVGKDVAFLEIYDEYDAVYLGTGDKGNSFDIDKDDNNKIIIDSNTFQTSMPGVFTGGSIIRKGNKYSPIMSISNGKRAAISMDRYAKKVSLAEGRKDEGQYYTKLYTNISNMNSIETVFPKDKIAGFKKDEAIQEAARCIQCDCLECVKVCKFLEEYKSYPKKYVREIANAVNIIHGVRKSKKLANSCTYCGLCEEVCPNSLDMGGFCNIAKTEMVKNGDMPPAIHDFPIQDMIFSNSDRFDLYRHQPGTNTSKYAFFPGCQLSALKPDYIIKSYGDLTKQLSGGVGLFLRCCGAPAQWAGRKPLFEETLKEFYNIWEKAGKPIIVYACSTCHQILSENFEDIQLVSIWQVFDKYGLPERDKPDFNNKTIALHDPCTSRHVSILQDSVRNVLGKLGYQIDELKYSKDLTKCCGFGGLVSFANKSLAKEMIYDRIRESDRDYVAYCAICQDHFLSEGKSTWHLLDFIYGDKNTIKNQKRLSFSQRHENRIKLKNKVMKEVFNEMYDENIEEHEKIELIISDEVQNKMEERLILASDIQKVIYNAESTGNKILNPKTNRFTSYYKPGIITYWVEYGIDDQKYIVYNAYSHRLEIKE